MKDLSELDAYELKNPFNPLQNYDFVQVFAVEGEVVSMGEQVLSSKRTEKEAYTPTAIKVSFLIRSIPLR